jgi:secreted trypsin-like serine protease
MRLTALFVCLLLAQPSIGQWPQSRIFDGFPADAAEFPWMVSLRFHDPSNAEFPIPICGGSILSAEFVVTAASCFFNAAAFTEVFTVQAGVNNIVDPDRTTEQLRSIAHIIIHPSYQSASYVNDVALVRVSLPFELSSSRVSTIALSNITAAGDLDLIAIGWGIVNQSDPTVAAALLQQVLVHEDVRCTDDSAVNASTQLCATGRTTRPIDAQLCSCRL